MHGTYPRILQDDVVGQAARDLFGDAQAMLDRIIAEKWLTARATAAIWPARRDGDDILVFEDDSRTKIRARLPMLRQQVIKREGRANCCLADYVSPHEDWIGGFSVTGGIGIEEKLAEFAQDKDDYSAILLKALADRFAEALAEALHFKLRTELWGYEQAAPPDYDGLIREQYQGIRPAPGYPACPDHSLKRLLFGLLQPTEKIGVTLTEHFAMVPTAAVSGFYFAHPESRYFGVARIGKDQLLDYTARRGVSLEQAIDWLRPNLEAGIDSKQARVEAA